MRDRHAAIGHLRSDAIANVLGVGGHQVYGPDLQSLGCRVPLIQRAAAVQSQIHRRLVGCGKAGPVEQDLILGQQRAWYREQVVGHQYAKAGHVVNDKLADFALGIFLDCRSRRCTHANALFTSDHRACLSAEQHLVRARPLHIPQVHHVGKVGGGGPADGAIVAQLHSGRACKAKAYDVEVAAFVLGV